MNKIIVVHEPGLYPHIDPASRAQMGHFVYEGLMNGHII